MVELAFIQFDGRDKSTKTEKRQVIRAHVMKNFHRQRKREAAERRLNLAFEMMNDGPDPSVEAGKVLNVANRSPCRSELGDVSCRQGSLESYHYQQGMAARNLPGPSFYSAMYASRILLPAFHTHVLIDQHVAHVELGSALLSSDPAASPLTTTWLPASRAHPYLYHASVFVCSASMETLTQKTLSPSSFYHRGLAIRMINCQLSDPIQCKADETLAAIIALANFECIIGNTSSLAYHVKGLLELAALRGGLDHLGMNGMLQKLIQIYVWFLDVFSHDAHPQALPGPLTSTECPASDLSTFYELITLETSVFQFHPSDISLLSILKHTFGLASEEPTNPLTQPPIGPSKPPSTATNQTLIHHSCHLSLLLYHSPPRSTPTQLYHLNALKDALHESDISGFWLPFPGALLWCLLVGTECAVGHDALYSWFASQLMRFWVPLSLHRWEGLERALGRFGGLIKQRRVGLCGGMNDC